MKYTIYRSFINLTNHHKYYNRKILNAEQPDQNKYLTHKHALDKTHETRSINIQAQLLQKDCAMLRVIEYFTAGHSKSLEIAPFGR